MEPLTDPYQEGKRLAKEGDFESAVSFLEQAARQYRDSPDVWLALGACYFRLDRNDDFREALRQALAIDPHHAPTRRFLKTLTGAEVIPAADTGRPKIYMREEEALKSRTQETQVSGRGCLGGFLLGACLIVFVLFA